MDDKAVQLSDAIEHETLTRIAEIYAGALRRALKAKKALLAKLAAVEAGKIKPPAYYVSLGPEGVARWREGWMQQLFRQEGLIEGIMQELNGVGVEAEKLIRGELAEVYKVNREYTVEQITARAGGTPVRASFSMPNRAEIDILVRRGESPFSKLAYGNMGQNPVILRRLQQSMAEACALGEGQGKLIARIRKITGQTWKQAKRVAQTERTRVQSQARWETMQEAAEMGIVVVEEWRARMVRTRDSHAALDGKRILQGGVFHTIWGNDLRYPGDPSAAEAREVINCHCVLRPDVLLPGQTLDENGNIVEASA